MGYAVYQEATRWAGYGVPAPCDWPNCDTEIDRGLGYKCEEHMTYETQENGEEIEREGEGCGLFFCSAHLYDYENHDDIEGKPDSAKWLEHMTTDESWQEWRDKNPEEYQKALADLKGTAE